MKNFIAITSLLVAGTAFASAATTFEWTGGASTNDWSTAENWNGGVVPTGDKTTAGDARNVVNIGSTEQPATVAYNSETSSSATAVQKAALASLIVNIAAESTLEINCYDAKVVNSTFNIEGVLSFGCNMWVDLPNTDTKTDSHPLTAPEFNLGSTGTISYSGAIASQSTAAMTLTGNFSISGDLGIKQRTLITSTGSATFEESFLTSTSLTLLFNGSAASAAIEEANLASSDVGKYWLSLSSDSKSIILNYVVPEPSMFGLLAGLGALALVAARRRRSRK